METNKRNIEEIFKSNLHQMYLMGAAIELKALVYHMTKL